MPYAKHFIPLESDPEIFTDLMHDIGVSPSLKFIDVWSFDDIQLQCNNNKVLAFILVVPPCAAYERQKTEPTTNAADGVIWLKQTINNACGLYAILHSVCNISGTVEPDSPLDHLINSPNRTTHLENSETIERAHTAAALRGSSDEPAADAHVEHHYICFLVRQRSDGAERLFVLDGDMEGPIEMTITSETAEGEGEEGGLVVSRQVLDVLKEYVRSSEEEGGTYSLMALVDSTR